MNYLSVFSGIGGFELGIRQAYEELSRSVGAELSNATERPAVADEAVRLRKRAVVSELPWHRGGQRTLAQEGHSLLSGHGRSEPVCVGFSEIDQYASQIYLRHFPAHRPYGDIARIDPASVPDIELICGGFPCQAFSLAGRRRGFRDTRGTLFFEIARLAAAKGPRLLLLENVKGLLSHDEGRTFYTIVAALDELGYDLQWQVLNSKDFAVPQNRERVFIVGHLRGTPRPQVFPFAPEHREDSEIGDEGLGRDGGIRNAGSLFAESRELHIRRLTPIECERLQGFPDHWTAEGYAVVGDEWERREFRSTKISDRQRYKTLGNAVTVNVVSAIAKRVLA